MAERGVIFAETPAKQIAKAAREFARRTVNEKPHRARWQQHRSASIQIRWGKITSVLGCGWYTVELGTLDGDYDASASLSASGDECSPCGNVTGAGTSGCAMTLTMPSPKVVGSGTSVMAYDPASIVIPLIAGTDCVVGKVPGTPTGSGSGTGGATETAWAVLRGFQQHSVDYKERWDCCEPDGPPVLVGKTPVVYIGFTCGEIACGECPE